MKKSKQLLAGCCLIAILFTGCRNGIQFNSNGKVYTEEDMTHFTSEKVAIDDLTAIDIESTYADFEIIASDGYYMEYSYYYINNEPTLTIEDGKLSFSDRDINTGSYSINMNHDNYLKLYIPTTTNFDSIKIAKSSGDCYVGAFIADNASITNRYGETMINNCKAETLELDVSSGKIQIEKSSINNLEIANTYGEVLLSELNVDTTPAKQLKVSMSSGTLELDDINIEEVNLHNSYGGIDLADSTIAKLTGFFDSGDVTVDNSSIGEVEIENSYGSVDLELVGKYGDYKYKIDNEYGTTTIGDEVYENSILIDRGAEKLIKLTVTGGDVEISFTE
jgi:DUF4097 and DUF4098 domain-containing protein YvlB